MTDPFSLRAYAAPRPTGGPVDLVWWVNLQLPWFRGLPFACLEDVTLSVGSHPVPTSEMAYRLDGELTNFDGLTSSDKYWGIDDTLQVGVPTDSIPPAAGTQIDIEVIVRMPEGSHSNGSWPRLRAKASTVIGQASDTVWPLGLCSFSFAGELRRGRSLRACLNEVGGMGGYAGIELLGPQVAEGYPKPPLHDLRRLGNDVRSAGLVPLVYGAYTDPGRRLGHATPDDLVDWATPSLDAAAALGCQFARINLPAQREVFERVAQLAQERDLVALTELHAMTSADPFVVSLLDVLAELDSPHVGLVLDLSCVMRSIPDGFVDHILRDRLPENAVRVIVDGWNNGDPEAATLGRLEDLGQGIADDGAPLLARTHRLFRRSDVSWLPDVLARTRMVHGKFFEMNEDGAEPSVPSLEIFDQLRKAAFDGPVLAEFEGHLWTEEPDTFGQLRRYRDMFGTLAHA